MSSAWVVNGKGLVHESLAEAAALSNPSTAATALRLAAVRKEIATLSYKNRTKLEEETYFKLESEEDQLLRALPGIRQKARLSVLGSAMTNFAKQFQRTAHLLIL